jgi:RHS repeat-associated protein
MRFNHASIEVSCNIPGRVNAMAAGTSIRGRWPVGTVSIEAARASSWRLDLTRSAHFVAILAAIVVVLTAWPQNAQAQMYGTGTGPGGPNLNGSDACAVARNQSLYYYGPQPNVKGCQADANGAVFFADNGVAARNGFSFFIGCASGYGQYSGLPSYTSCMSNTPPNAPMCPTGKNPPALTVTDPTNLNTGALQEDVVDYETAGPFPLRLERLYSTGPRFAFFNSSLFAPSGFSATAGGAWRSNFDLGFAWSGSNTNPQNVYLGLPNGRQLAFVSPAVNGVYVPAQFSGGYPAAGGTGVRETLTFDPINLVFTLVTAEGVNYIVKVSATSLATNATVYSQLTTIKFPGGYSQSLTYDPSSGLLTSVTDSLGRTLGFQYGAQNQVTAVTAGEIAVATYSYIDKTDTSGLAQYFPDGIPPAYLNLTLVLGSVTRTASGETTSYSYGDPNNPFSLTSVTDARGIVYSTWTYDSSGRVVSNVLAGPVDQTTISYASGVNTATNALGDQQVLTTTTTTGGSLLPSQLQGQPTSHLPLSTTTYQFDAQDFLSQLTDAESRATTLVNDPTTGLPTSITRGAGTPNASTTTYTWNTQWRVPTQIVEPGRTTIYAWNSTGQLTQLTQTDTTTTSSPYSTSGQTRTWTYAYGSTGLVSSVTGPLPGEVVSYAYNLNGFLKSVTDEAGLRTIVTAWNSLGQPTSITDPKGVITALGYDGDGRLTSVSVDTANNPATTTIAYDQVGDVTQITDPIGGVQTFTYDGARRLQTITNSAGETVTYGRDALGGATSITVTNGSSTTTYSKQQGFDELGRLIQSMGSVPANSTYNFGYDKTDNLTSVTDPRSYVFTYGFDALNRLIQTIDEESDVVSLTRNGVAAITAYQDPRSLTTNYVRDGFSGIIQEASPDKGTWMYVRDGRGDVTQRTDPRGAVPSVADLPVADSRVLDTKGNVIHLSRTVSATPAFTSNYAYDLAGNVTSVTYPSGRIVNFQRDTLGRITGVTTNQSSGASSQTIASSISWVPYSGVNSLTFGNGIVQTFTRDTDDRITGVVATTSSAATVLNRTLAWTGETLDSITDNQFPGNMPPFTYTAQSQSFTYTPTHRLASAVGYYGSYAWAYDPTGNRTSETANGAASAYTYPTTSNQLASITPSSIGTVRSFGYDAAGDITSDSASAGGSAPAMSYQYDAEGRLAKAYQTSTPSTEATYAYDSDSRLSSRTVAQGSPPTSTTILYAYDVKDHIIAELNATGQTLREYIWLNDMPIAVVDNVNTTPVIYYVQVDHLMRPARMTDSSANWVWDVIFTPFGTTAYINQNPTVMDIRFPGQWFQLETGLAYNWHRHYDATTGRYSRPDPIDFSILLSRGTSPYSYVDANPLFDTDSSGLVRHVTGKTIQCSKGCTIRIDYFLDEQTGKITRHLHWECPGQSGVGGEFGGVSHGDTLENAPRNVKECARNAGFEPDASTPSNLRTACEVALGVGTTYLIYRGIRMLPSLFPPLWPTIPFNAAVP